MWHAFDSICVDRSSDTFQANCQPSALSVEGKGV